MTRPPFRTSSSRYIRAVQSRQTPLNLSKLPKLPEGTPPLISRGSTPGNLDHNVTRDWRLKAVDDDFVRAVRLEAIAEKKSGNKSSQRATRFPFVHLPNVDIRMIPKKLLAAREPKQPPILSKNPRKERSDLSLFVITPKATVHRFAVVRVRVRRRVVGAVDLIVRRGVVPFSESIPKGSNKLEKSKGNNLKLEDSEEPKVLLHDSTLAGHQAWILPDWTYMIFPNAEVFRMPLPDLVDQIRLGLQQVNQKARAWQDQYVSPETGEFIPSLSKGLQKPPPPESKSRKPKEPRSGRREGKKSGIRKFQESPRHPLGTQQNPPDAHLR